MYEDPQMAEHLANDCLWEAKEYGITEADLMEAAGGDLKAYMLAELNRPSRGINLRKRLRHDFKHSLAPIAPWLDQIGVELTLNSLSALNLRRSRNARASAA
jgi:hypothetical protein